MVDHRDDKPEPPVSASSDAAAKPAEAPAKADATHRHSVKDFIREHVRHAKPTERPPIHVLIVDDEAVVRRLVERILREVGYVTSEASDGVEALEVAAAMPQLDLLVTDLMMPRMTGDELARRLRQSAPTVKVLYLTAYADRLFVEKVTLWEGEAFLEKPFTVRGLRQAVELLLFGHFADAEPPPS